MPEQKRCKECKKPIDGDGEYCVKCQIGPWRPREGMTSSELKEKLRQGEIMQQNMADTMKKHLDNPC
jgi:hypothetical protein